VCHEPATLTTSAGAFDRDALFADNRPLAEFFLKRFMLPPGADLDDARQAALMGLWRAATRFDPSRDRKFSTLATLCVRQLVIKHLRREDRQRRLPLSGEARLGRVADPRPGPGHDMELADMVARVRRALQALPPRVAEAFELCYLRGLSREEAAAVMGVTKLGVKVQVNGAKKLLAEIIGAG
jgi:RNA polymerase sigma factor CnrH